MVGNNIIEKYVFDKINRTITLNDFEKIHLHKLLIIIDITNQTVIYQPNVAGKGASVNGNVITLDFNTNTSAFSNSDVLHIVYHDDSIGIKTVDGAGYIATDGLPSPLTFESDGSLRIKGLVSTDDGSVRVNFYNTSLETNISGCSFTNGTKIVYGTGFSTTGIKVGDYIKLGSDANSAFTRVQLFTDTQITLTAPYPGTTGTGTAVFVKVLPTITNNGNITVNNALCTINSGTTSGTVFLRRIADYLPLDFKAKIAINQRVSSQSIEIGFFDEMNDRWFALFSMSGTNPNILNTVSGYNPSNTPSSYEIETNTIDLKQLMGINTSHFIEYGIQINVDKIYFTVNGENVAIHTKSIPDVNSIMSFGIKIKNNSTISSSTDAIIEYILLKNHTVVEQSVWNKKDFIPTIKSRDFKSENINPIPTLSVPYKSSFFSFEETITSGINANFEIIYKDPTHSVSQQNGLLLINSGTTPNTETIIRSKEYFRGPLKLVYHAGLTSRVNNNSFIVELVDVIGDNIPFTFNATTSIVTLNIPNHNFTSLSIGQRISLGGFNNITSGTAVPGRYEIVSVASDSIGVSVSIAPSFTAVSGFCSVFGLNHIFCLYQGTNTNQMNFSSRRGGWEQLQQTVVSTNNTIITLPPPNATNNGHICVIDYEQNTCTLHDRNPNSSFGVPFIKRGDRNTNVPDINSKLFLQIRCQNLASSSSIPTVTFASSFFEIQNINPNNIPFTLNSNVNQISHLTVRSQTQSGGGSNIGASYEVGSSSLNTSLWLNQTTDISSGTISSGPEIYSPTFSSANPAFMIHCSVTNITPSTGASFDLKVQELITDGSTQYWYDIYHFERIFNQGIYSSPFLTATSRSYRLVQKVNSPSTTTTATVTRSIFRISRSTNKHCLLRSFYLRPGTEIIDLSTVGSLSHIYNVINAEKIAIVFSLNSGGTANIQLMGSLDKDRWFDIGTPLSGVNNGTVFAKYEALGIKYIRLRVVNKTSSPNLNYINITCE